MNRSRLSLQEYREMVSDLPRPTRQQMEAFALHISGAHSWYKHLPALPPGVPFHFWLDPAAGLDRVSEPDGTLRMVARHTKGFHYASLPTAEYRDRFGFLAYGQNRATEVTLARTDGTSILPSDGVGDIFDVSEGRLRALPAEVIRAGTAWVSGLIHVRVHYGMLHADLLSYASENWPSDSGGKVACETIKARCRALIVDRVEPEHLSIESIVESGLLNLHGIDMALHRLLEPERDRQRREMVAAIERASALL